MYNAHLDIWIKLDLKAYNSIYKPQCFTTITVVMRDTILPYKK